MPGGARSWGFSPKIPVEGQSWGTHTAWMGPGAPKIRDLCKAGAVLGPGLLRLLPAAKMHRPR